MDSPMLDDLDRQLVHALQIDGRAPFNRVATVLGVSDQTVARRYRKLRSSGTMRVLGLPNARRFGYVEWLVHVQCTPDAAMSVAQSLARRDDTSWVSLTSGGTEIVFLACARSHTEQESLLLQKLPRTPRVVMVTAHHILHMFSGGPSGWHGKAHALAPNQIAQLSPLTTPSCRRDSPLEMHKGDAALLAALAVDGRTSYSQLAKATESSESAVKRRMDELRKLNALFFDVEIDSSLLGYDTRFMLWLSVSPSNLVTVAQQLSGHPEIAFSAATTGPANLVAIAVCRDAGEFYEYLTGRIGSLKPVSHLETVPIIRVVKRAGKLTPGLHL
jgi:DNA-binding Lrp family transcriptional regulator